MILKPTQAPKAMRDAFENADGSGPKKNIFQIGPDGEYINVQVRTSWRFFWWGTEWQRRPCPDAV